MTRATRFASIFFLLFCFKYATVSATPVAPQSSTAATKSKHSKKKDKSSDEKPAKAGKLDLNTASKDELDALPGIGDALAQKIIAGRPYHSKHDLVSNGVLPASAYDKIKDEVTAHRAKSGGESSGATASTPSAVSPSANTPVPNTGSSGSGSRDAGASSSTQAQEPPQKGMVWVNLDSGVYHREGDRWYGKTKHGKFMTEADAQKAGYRASKTGPKGE